MDGKLSVNRLVCYSDLSIGSSRAVQVRFLLSPYFVYILNKRINMDVKKAKGIVNRFIKGANLLKNKPNRMKLIDVLVGALGYALRGYWDIFISEMIEARKLFVKFIKFEKKSRDYWSERSAKRRREIEKEEELWRSVRFDR